MSFFKSLGVSQWLFGLGCLGVGVFVGYIAQPQITARMDDVGEVGDSYTFINPLLFCGDQGLSSLTNRASRRIEAEVRSYISKRQAEGKLHEMSVYYKDLAQGPWALVNGRMDATPGSLLKLPLAISIYKHAEKDPSFLGKAIAFAGGVDANEGEHYKPRNRIVAGKSYTVAELLRFALVDSDNNAALLLMQLLTWGEVKDSYSKLGLDAPVEGEDYEINVRTYASFFRILFNSSYLTTDASEQLLKQLSQSSFEDGIAAGVPETMTVSHKFGERYFNGETQLHDCGIIYKKNDPYILCIMTRGQNFDHLAESLRDVSRMVYAIVTEEDTK